LKRTLCTSTERATIDSSLWTRAHLPRRCPRWPAFLLILLYSLCLEPVAAANDDGPFDCRRQIGIADGGFPLYIRPRVGLALSGGAAKLFYELGFVAALERGGIPVDAIAGTSAGAIVGAYYAYGYSPEERYRKLVDEIDWMGLFRDQGTRRERFFYRDPSTQTRGLHIHFVRGRFEGIVSNLFPEGLSGGQKMNNILVRDLPRASLFKDPSLDPLFTPTAIVATRVKHPAGSEFRAYSGRLIEAVRASVEFPIFLPVYFWRENPGPAVAAIDGGVVNNIPVDVLSNISAGTGIVTNSTETIRLPRPEYSIGMDLTRPIPIQTSASAASAADGRAGLPPSKTEPASSDWLLKFVYGIDIDLRTIDRKEEGNRDLADSLVRFTLKDETVVKLFDFRKQRNRNLYVLGERLLSEELPIEIRYSFVRLPDGEVLEGPVFVGLEHLYPAGERRAANDAIQQLLQNAIVGNPEPEKSLETAFNRLVAGMRWPAGVRRDPAVLVEPSRFRRELTLRFGWYNLKDEFRLGLEARADRMEEYASTDSSSFRIEDVRIGRNSLMDQQEFRQWIEKRALLPDLRAQSLPQVRQYAGLISGAIQQTGLFVVESVELASRLVKPPESDKIGPVLDVSLVFQVKEKAAALAAGLKTLRDSGKVLARLKSSGKDSGFELDEGPTVRQVLLADLTDAEGQIIEVHASKDYLLREFQRLRGRIFNLRDTLRALDDTSRQGHYRILKFFLQRVGDGGSEVDLVIEAEEKPTSEINLAARFDLEEMYSFYTSYSFSNLGRRGGQLYTDAIYGALTRWRGNLELPLGRKLFGQNEYWFGSRKQEVYSDGNAFDSYKEKSLGGLWCLGYRLGENWWHSLGYRLEWTDLNQDFQNRQAGLLPVGDGRLASVVYRHGYDTLDSFPYGTQGFKLDLTFEAARKSWGSRYDYNRFEMNTQKPFLLTPKGEHVLNLRSNLGLSAGEVPLTELFGVGGMHENPLMGFNRRELLAKHFATLNLSHRFLIYKLPVPESRAFFGKLYWNTQVDAGFVADIIRKQGFGTFRKGFGLGLLLDTNFGLIKMMYGVNGERKGQLYLSLAYEI
jgi:predicted acylesterase/phospholipase RssA